MWLSFGGTFTCKLSVEKLEEEDILIKTKKLLQKTK
jgi:hypothetical protein